jgi:hypothetical protein
VLATLARDENAYVREKVARNPNLPPEAAAILRKDSNEDVRLAFLVEEDDDEED